MKMVIAEIIIQNTAIADLEP